MALNSSEVNNTHPRGPTSTARRKTKIQLVHNLVANVGSQVWILLLSIVALPLYLRELGPESYALIGFGLTIQGSMILLDGGMGPALAREMARLRSGEVAERDVHSLFRSLDWLGVAVASAVITVGILTRHWWSEEWFRSHDLPGSLVGEAMALMIAFSMVRVVAGLYRSALLGLERQVFASSLSAFTTTVRLIVPIFVVAHFPDVRVVFGIWLAAAVAELVIFRVAAGSYFQGKLPILHFSLAALRGPAKLAGGIVVLAMITVLLSQLDKLLLSRLLDLRDYGYFSLAVVLANGVLMLALPVTQAFQPRLTAAAGASDHPALRDLVEKVATLTMLFVITPTLVIVAFPQRTVFAWTGDFVAAAALAPYLGLYVLGSALAATAGVAYALQLAHGNVRLHVFVNMLFALVLVPGIWLAAAAQGALGASLVWFALNLALFIFYLPTALERFLPGEARRSLLYLLPLASGVGGATFLSRSVFGDAPSTRPVDLAILGVTAIIAVLLTLVVSPSLRGMQRQGLRNLIGQGNG